MFASLLLVLACAKDDASNDTQTFAEGSAWDAFGANVSTYADGEDVVIETNGWPDHTSPYWGPDHELYVEPDPSQESLTPGFIERFVGTFTLTVPANPEKASTSTATSQGPIGIAVSGSVIYNDTEGQNQPIDQAAGSLDYTGAHTGPLSYHYHLETKAWSDDDDALIGVMADGFFLFGRKCASTDAHPQDLDASYGHLATTQYHESPQYHYHIPNEAYLDQYYLLFPGDYQGSPSTIQ